MCVSFTTRALAPVDSILSSGVSLWISSPFAFRGTCIRTPSSTSFTRPCHFSVHIPSHILVSRSLMPSFLRYHRMFRSASRCPRLTESQPMGRIINIFGKDIDSACVHSFRASWVNSCYSHRQSLTKYGFNLNICSFKLTLPCHQCPCACVCLDFIGKHNPLIFAPVILVLASVVGSVVVITIVEHYFREHLDCSENARADNKQTRPQSSRRPSSSSASATLRPSTAPARSR